MDGFGPISPRTVLIAWQLGWLLCFLAGRRHRREAGASVVRLTCVSLLLAGTATVSLWLAVLLGEKIDLSWADPEALTELPDGSVVLVSPPGESLIRAGPWPVNVFVAILAWLMSLRFAAAALRPVASLGHRSGELPPLDDAGVLARIDELARSLGAPVPRALLLGSADASQTMYAATGGSLGPVILLTDGLLKRLPAGERDAVIAHELAHIARRSLWVMVALVFAAHLAATLASAALFPAVSVALGLALMWTALRVYGHFDEPACDLRAARSVGVAAMAAALDKIHAPQQVGSRRLMRLVHATQTHPSLEIRLQHLARSAPPDQRPTFPLDADEIARQRRLQRAVALALLATLAVAVWGGVEPALKWPAVGALALVILLPPLLLVLAVLQDLVFAWRIGSLRLPLQRILVPLAAGAMVITTLLALVLQSWLLLAAGPLAFAVVWSLGRPQSRLRDRIDRALRAREFDRAVELHEVLARLPRPPGRRRRDRCAHALALALAGDRTAAVAELEDLLRTAPRFPAAKFDLALLLRIPDPFRALQLAGELAAALPNSPHVLSLRAGLLRRVGRWQEAREVAAHALRRRPRDGWLHALAARIEVTAGDFPRARALLAEAERREPASALGALVRAELAVAEGSPDAGERVAAAARAAEDNPFALLEEDVRELRERRAGI